MTPATAVLLALSIARAQAPAAQPVWNAATADRPAGIHLALRHPGEWRIQRIGGRPYAALARTDRYYGMDTFEARLDAPPGPAAWLTLTYLDRGYGLIAVDAVALGAEEVSGNTRLNTGTVRKAVFRLAPDARVLNIRGLPLLAEIAIVSQQPPRQPIPPHEPAVRLRNAPNLVMGNLAGTGMPEARPGSVAHLRNVLPLVRALGFNGVESYVQWNVVERSPGVFDWSAYDAIVDECERNGLGWFPLIVIGSAYALPDWYHESPEFVGFRCQEHGISIDVPTIFHPGQIPYVRRFLKEFGKHYAGRKALLGFRLGPTSNFGEAQYPASGPFGYQGQWMHTHIGYWAGDPYAIKCFQDHLRTRYAAIGDLNAAWGGTTYRSFEEVQTFLPAIARNDRMRADFSAWYMNAMSDWCERWAVWAREALPTTPMYQSSGGWGPVEIGTDYVAHTRSIAKLGGGIRMTNENDSFLNNFCVTRPAASAARYYGAWFATEPAGFNCRRGVAGRLYNVLTNNGRHLFFYQFNLFDNNRAIETWIQNVPLLDQREQCANDIAAFYPDTANRLSDSIMRYLNSSLLFTAAKAFRSVTDYDFASEQLILDGALSRYRVLVFLAGRTTEQPVLQKIDAWVRAGGIVIYPIREASSELPLATVEGDASIYSRWRQGDTGKGRAIFYDSHPEPGLYIRFLKETLPTLDVLRPETRAALRIQKPEDTYWSLLASGKLALLNYGDRATTVRLPAGKSVRLDPYTLHLE